MITKFAKRIRTRQSVNTKSLWCCGGKKRMLFEDKRQDFASWFWKKTPKSKNKKKTSLFCCKSSSAAKIFIESTERSPNPLNGSSVWLLTSWLPTGFLQELNHLIFSVTGTRAILEKKEKKQYRRIILLTWHFIIFFFFNLNGALAAGRPNHFKMEFGKRAKHAKKKKCTLMPRGRRNVF